MTRERVLREALEMARHNLECYEGKPEFEQEAQEERDRVTLLEAMLTEISLQQKVRYTMVAGPFDSYTRELELLNLDSVIERGKLERLQAKGWEIVGTIDSQMRAYDIKTSIRLPVVAKLDKAQEMARQVCAIANQIATGDY